MASPRLASGGTAAFSPAVNGGDEAIWKRLREAGLDEDTVKRRDKSALIAYISKLETEIYEYQHNMGLLLLERKEWNAKYEQLKASTESSEIKNKQERAAQASELAEARKREEGLKKALGIEKECVANIEKALRDMRVEWAETKVAYEKKLEDARLMMDSAQRKLDEAGEKMLAARSLEADASRARDAALRSIQDVEAREDELRRRLLSLQSEHDGKEQEIVLQRKSLNETREVLHREEERLLEKQSILNQREQYIFDRLDSLNNLEKRLELEKSQLESERKSLLEEKNNLSLKISALSTREEAVIEKESLLEKRERDLLILQETVACKEQAEIQRLTDEQQSLIGRRKSELEAEMLKKQVLFEEEMDSKKFSLDERESSLDERSNFLTEKEKLIDIKSSELAEKERELAEKSKQLVKVEEKLKSAEREEGTYLESIKIKRDEIEKMRVDLEKDRFALEEERKEILRMQGELEITQAERNEIFLLEAKLKEEIDSFRAQKKELSAEAERLQAERERFEIEWEMIDEKKEDLAREAERIEEEKRAVREHLKSEHEMLKSEKESLRLQLKSNAESLAHEREEFMSSMQAEHSSWLSQVEREREDFKRDMEIQRSELEASIKARREEVESLLKEKEGLFERKKGEELRYIESQKEVIAKQFEHVEVELGKLAKEREEIALEREKREKELAEIKETIDALNTQREKLKEQRELLRADRESINGQIKKLNELEEANIEAERRALFSTTTRIRTPVKVKESDLKENGDGNSKLVIRKIPEGSGSRPRPSPVGWVRKCTEIIFRRSPERILEQIEGYSNEKEGENNRDASVSGRKRPNDTELEPNKKQRIIMEDITPSDRPCSDEGGRPGYDEQSGKPESANFTEQPGEVLHFENGGAGPHPDASTSKQKEVIDLVSEEDDEEPSERFTPVLAEENTKSGFDLSKVEQEERDQDEGGEGEERVSVKEKLWNFLITLVG